MDEVMRNYNFMVKSQWIVRSFIDLMQRSYYTCCYRYLVPNVNFSLRKCYSYLYEYQHNDDNFLLF